MRNALLVKLVKPLVEIVKLKDAIQQDSWRNQ
jgi:hypothetical protein